MNRYYGRSKGSRPFPFKVIAEPRMVLQKAQEKYDKLVAQRVKLLRWLSSEIQAAQLSPAIPLTSIPENITERRIALSAIDEEIRLLVLDYPEVER